MPETISSQKLTYTLDSLSQVASTLINEGGTEPLWFFYGDLGAGKTTLIKQVCLQLGVNAGLISSPTFSIINEYPSAGGTICHFDFYRMKNEMEILDLGIEEYFDSGNFCFVEWPERLGSIMPRRFFKISITESSSISRIIEFEKHA